jgi:hypothetical protein
MSSYYSLDDIGINAAYKEQQFKYSAEQYHLRRVSIAVRRIEKVDEIDILLPLKKMTRVFMRKMHHCPVTSLYTDNPQLMAAENGQTKV